MSNQIRFVEHCPECGRSIEMGLSMLGRRVACHHCQHVFSVKITADPDPKNSFLDEKVERLLAAADRQLASVNIEQLR